MIGPFPYDMAADLARLGIDKASDAVVYMRKLHEKAWALQAKVIKLEAEIAKRDAEDMVLMEEE